MGRGCGCWAWHVRVGSNHRPRPSESRALAAELRTYRQSGSPDDFALPRSGRTSRSGGPKAEHEVRANVDLRFVSALLCLCAKGLLDGSGGWIRTNVPSFKGWCLRPLDYAASAWRRAGGSNARGDVIAGLGLASQPLATRAALRVVLGRRVVSDDSDGGSLRQKAAAAQAAVLETTSRSRRGMGRCDRVSRSAPWFLARCGHRA